MDKQLADPPERKYVLTRIAKGDYLLPSNDGRTLWRLRIYEDGPTHGLEDWPRDRTFWGLWKLTSHFDGTLDPDTLDDWGRWEPWDEYLPTRAAAIKSALRERVGH